MESCVKAAERCKRRRSAWSAVKGGGAHGELCKGGGALLNAAERCKRRMESCKRREAL